MSEDERATSAKRDRPVGGAAPLMQPMARYRCDACGNLTRFDVTEERRTRAFHHYSVGGELSIESVEVLYATIHDVSCRWCGHGRAVVPYGSPTVEVGPPATSIGDPSATSSIEGVGP